MKTIRSANERGTADFGWLQSRHSFSFGQYYDPNKSNWGALRVINDDRVAPGAGFPTHPHRDMEIFSYVTKGALAHEDCLGNKEVLTPGRIQLMSAGTGIRHSEFNPSESEPAHFLQIWIQPHTIGLEPSYQEMEFSPESMADQWKLLMAPDAMKADNHLQIHQNTKVSVSSLSKGKTIEVPSSIGKKGYLHVISGEIESTDERLKSGDAFALEDEPAFAVYAIDKSEILYFELDN